MIDSSKPIPAPWEIDRSKRYYAPCIRHNGLIVAILPDNSAGLVKQTDRIKAVIRDDRTAKLLQASPDLLDALEMAEGFMSGFEDDEVQEGINDKLATIRAAIKLAKTGER